MVALLDAMADGTIDADPALVLSDVPAAGGLEIAAARGVPTATIDNKKIRPREAHEERVIEALREREVDLVCLAGYMRMLGPKMVGAFRNRMLNIHPSLLPVFPGLHAQRQALEHGVKVSGCTVHLVDDVCDHGPIVLQAAVPVHDDDTEDSLAARILEQEHRIYPQAVALHVSGRLRVDGCRVRAERDA